MPSQKNNSVVSHKMRSITSYFKPLIYEHKLSEILDLTVSSQSQETLTPIFIENENEKDTLQPSAVAEVIELELESTITKDYNCPEIYTRSSLVELTEDVNENSIVELDVDDVSRGHLNMSTIRQTNPVTFVNAFSLMKKKSSPLLNSSLYTLHPVSDYKFYGIDDMMEVDDEIFNEKHLVSIEKLTNNFTNAKFEFSYNRNINSQSLNRKDLIVADISSFCSDNEQGEIYKNFIFDYFAKTQLAEWLQMHRKYKENLKDSDDEEIYTNNEDPEDISVLLTGPHGCGKTFIINEVAKELNFSIIELNSSHKRDSESLLNLIQETTKSQNVLNLFDTLKKSTSHENFINSVIVVEEIENVFPIDQGFLSTLTSIIRASKRPFIFVSNLPEYYWRNVSPFASSLAISVNSPQFNLTNHKEGDKITNAFSYFNSDPRKTLLNFSAFNYQPIDLFSTLLQNHASIDQFLNYFALYCNSYDLMDALDCSFDAQNNSIYPIPLYFTPSSVNQLSPTENDAIIIFLLEKFQIPIEQVKSYFTKSKYVDSLREMEEKIYSSSVAVRKRKRIDYSEFYKLSH